MKQGFLAVALTVVLLSVAAGVAADQSTSSAGVTPSPQLLKILQGIQELDSGGLLAIRVWASYSKPDLPSPNLTPLDQIETDILLKLAPADRSAILSWLDHGGRSKLYARGLTDADIGPCVDNIDAANCNTASSSGAAAVSAAPPSFRDLPFTLAPGSNQDGGIAIEHGFAMVKTDATSETHCLTFKNAGLKKVDAVTFIYKLHAQNGEVVYAGSNLRAGNFDPGAEVPGVASAADFSSIRSDSPDKEQLANCWTKTTQLATPALLRATYITVGVASVTYDDGTHWALDQ